MARRVPAPTPPPAQTLVASARRIDLKDKDAARKALAKPQSWQEDAWTVYDLVGQVKYPLNYRANAISRLRLFGAVRPIPDQPPIPVEDPRSGIDAETARKVQAAIDRLKAEVGGQRALIRTYALNMDVAAECYLVGEEAREEVRDERDPTRIITPARDERWAIYSVTELKAGEDGTVKVYEGGQGDGRRLDDDAFVLRIWNPHARFQNRPDCELRGVLLECDELLILSRMIRAQARSRTSAGILFLNSRLDFKKAQRTGDDGDGQAQGDDPFLSDLMAAMTTPTRDEGDPTSIVPMVVKGDGEHIGPEKNWLLRLDRPLDQLGIELRKELKTTIAQGLPMPPEVTLGMQEANHWTAWAVTEDTFRSHIEPAAISMLDALTGGYLVAALEADGIDRALASTIFIWYDETELVTKPNRAKDAKDAHAAMVISDEALRDALGFNDADAPTPEEIAQRIAIKRGTVDTPLTEALLALLLPKLVENAQEQRAEEAPAPVIDVPSEDTTPAAAPEEEAAPEEPAAIAAAAERRTLGHRLAEIDSLLASRLEVAVDAAMTRALEKAGARLRSKINGNQALRAAVANVPQWAVAATLGPTIVATTGFTDEELLAGAFDDLAGRYESWTAQAQTDALAAVEDTYGELPEDRSADVVTVQEEERRESWQWMLGALVALAAARLYDPTPHVPTQGEADPTMSVPVPLVREAMTRAGGAGGLAAQPIPGGGGNRLVAADGAPSGSVATGQTVLAAAREVGAERDGWEWEYGAFGRSQRPFDGHLRLDGLRFTSWDDEALAVLSRDAWLGEAYYAPGDHDGCRCYAVPMFAAIHRGSYKPDDTPSSS